MHQSVNKLAVSATLHCLTGCAVGEIGGLLLGEALTWPNTQTIIVSIVLAFVCGYGLSTWSLLRAHVSLGRALPVVFAADSLSILTMEIFDNLVVVAIPGAMAASFGDVLYWVSLALALVAAFIAAFPVNRWLLLRGKGHALTHQFHHGHHDSE